MIPSFWPATVYGGTIFSSLKTCQTLSELGCDVAVCTTNANEKTRLNEVKNRFLYDLGFPVKYYNETFIGKFSCSLLLGLWRDIKKSDIIHIQSIFSTPTPIALFYSWIFQKDVILSPRGSLGAWCLEHGSRLKGLWLSLFIGPFLGRATWHATSEQEKSEILAVFPESEIEIVANGITVADYSKPYSSKKVFFDKFSISQEWLEGPMVISMGRIVKIKAFDVLIESFQDVKAKFPQACLLVAGPDYGELDNLMELTKKLQLEESVYFIGSISGQDKVDFYKLADIFALPSHNENFGNVYAEALASGTPIVASKNTPWQEAQKAGCAKWVDNTRDKTAKAINDLIEASSDDLSRKCKDYIADYDWKNIAIKMNSVYQSV